MSNASAITGSASVAGGTASGVPLSNEYPVDVLSGQRNPRGIPQMLFFDEAPPTVAPQLSSGDGASSAGGGLVGWLFNSVVMPLAFPLVRHNLVPDFLLRLGVRMVCREVLRRQEARPLQQQVADKAAYVADLRSRGVLAVATADANKQHYEVPAAFFELVMGKHKKYSCGIWPELDAAAAGLARPAAATTLDESEALALALVCERAKIEDVAGTRVLDMGCGWGSFTLFAAARFPRVAFTALSNSASQKRFIDAQAAARGLANVTVVTCDINEFEGSGGGFDRVVSIEMMEHVKNYDLLLRRVASWMRPGALMFVHIFTHRLHPFHYEKGWMAENVSSSCRSPHPARTPHPTLLTKAKHPATRSLTTARPLIATPTQFFAGGQMPSDDLLLYFQRDLRIVDRWAVQGTHYERTSNAWLASMDKNKARVMPVLADIYGKDNAALWFVNWRLFFIACAELFGLNNGNEYAVSHYLFQRPA